MTPDLVDFVALSLLPIWTWRAVGERLRAGDAPATALDRLLDGRRPRSPDQRSDLLASAAAALARAAEEGLTPIAWSDPAYPPALAAIVDPPPVLWTRGLAAAFDRPAVAIVGSRAASSYALDVAGRLAADLAARGLTVVSGLARGVDSAAHRGALSVGQSTIAVLGCGADVDLSAGARRAGAGDRAARADRERARPRHAAAAAVLSAAQSDHQRVVPCGRRR